VSDTAAMNAPTYPPPYNPYASAVPGNMPSNMSMYDDRNAVPPPYASAPGNTNNMVECEGNSILYWHKTCWNFSRKFLWL